MLCMIFIRSRDLTLFATSESHTASFLRSKRAGNVLQEPPF